MKTADAIVAYAKTYLFNRSVLDVEKIQDEFGQWLAKDSLEFLEFKIRILEEAVRIEREESKGAA